MMGDFSKCMCMLVKQCMCMYVQCMYNIMYSLLLSLCYKLLENPGFVREKTARDKVFGLMGSLMKRFNVALGKFSMHIFTLPLVDLVDCCKVVGIATVLQSAPDELNYHIYWSFG